MGVVFGEENCNSHNYKFLGFRVRIPTNHNIHYSLFFLDDLGSNPLFITIVVSLIRTKVTWTGMAKFTKTLKSIIR